MINQQMNIDFQKDILQPVAKDFNLLDQFIYEGMNSKVALVMKVSEHVVQAGGKRMRPLMTILASYACLPTRLDHTIPYIRYAAIIEMLHTATLVHDDVVDESMMRRGHPTANATWNNPTAVLVGDFLIARAFDLLVGLKNMTLLETFSAGTCDLAEGEVLQLQHQHNPESTEKDYFNIIYGKTSRLFMLAAEGAALITGQEQFRENLRKFALHFGNAFQIIDDVLDYTSDKDTMGKNVGDDLMEGKPTLPLIAAKKMASEYESSLVHKAILTGGLDNLDQIVSILHTSGALEYCRNKAFKETERALGALGALPESIYKTALANMAHLALERLK